MATLTFDELQAEYKAAIAVSDARYDLIQKQAAQIAELKADLEFHKAERILLQQEVRSLRRLDPAE